MLRAGLTCSIHFLGGIVLIAGLTLQPGLAHREAAFQATKGFTPPTSIQEFARHNPNRRVFFTITLEEKGSAGTETGWSMKGEGRYALLPTWDGFRGVDPGAGLSAEQKRMLGLEVAATAEDLFDLRGGFLALKEGESLQFYLKESEDQGRGWVDKDQHSWVGSKRDGTSTSTLDGRYTSTRREDLADSMDARLVRTKTGARIQFHWWLDPGWEELGVSASLCGFSRPEAARVLTFELSDEDLRNWDRIAKTNQGTIRHDEDAGVAGTMTATLSAVRVAEDEVEVSVEPGTDYVSWIPEGNKDKPDEPGKDLEVSISVHKKGEPGKPRKALLSISIPYVSTNQGVCGNWPQGAGEGEGLRFRKEDFPKEKDGLLFIDKTHLEADVLLEEARIRVHAYDYGAWGSLRVTARDLDGKEVKVRVRGKDSPDLDIPLDDNANRIADAWEVQKGVKGFPADWDEAEVEGQTVKGDGLTLYQKYRGVVVQGISGKQYARLEPREKVHFVIDPAGVFDADRWRRSTGIRAYKLTSDMVASDRKMDVNRGDPSGNGKYAVRIEIVKGTADPPNILDPIEPDKNVDRSGQIAYSVGPKIPFWTPKDVDRILIFPDRIGAQIDDIVTKMKRALTNPTTPADQMEAQRLRQLGQETGLTIADILRISSNFDASAREERIQRMVALLAIHETGHACSVNGHLNSKGEEDENLNRTPGCPSSYLDQMGRRRFILLGELGGGGTFCKAPPDQCWMHLNVKEQ